MDVLLHVEAVHSAQNTRALRCLFDNVSSHIRSLQSLGVDPGSYGSLLCPVLLTKLPAELQLTISRKVTEADWNLDSLMRAVEEEIIAREIVLLHEEKITLHPLQLPWYQGQGIQLVRHHPVVIATSCIIQPIVTK